jgi:hypothetical protein
VTQDVDLALDHLQPWQANEGHPGQAWVTIGALCARAPRRWMGTTVTCPLFRYTLPLLRKRLPR